MPGCLVDAQVAPVAEDGQQVTPCGIAELGIRPGNRAEVARVVRPVLDVFEHIEQVALPT